MPGTGDYGFATDRTIPEMDAARSQRPAELDDSRMKRELDGEGIRGNQVVSKSGGADATRYELGQ